MIAALSVLAALLFLRAALISLRWREPPTMMRFEDFTRSPLPLAIEDIHLNNDEPKSLSTVMNQAAAELHIRHAAPFVGF